MFGKSWRTLFNIYEHLMLFVIKVTKCAKAPIHEHYFLVGGVKRFVNRAYVFSHLHS